MEHSVHNASIPSRTAEAAATQIEARAHAFRRLATGGAIALAAVGIGLGLWLSMHEPRNADGAAVEQLQSQLDQAAQENQSLREEQANTAQQLRDLESRKDDSRIDSSAANRNAELERENAEQQQALQNAQRTITDLQQRLDSMTGGDPLTNYTIFKTKIVPHKGRVWEVTTGHDFASNSDKQWRHAWCYVTPDVDGVLIKVDLVQRPSPEAPPQTAVASAATLTKAGLDNADALYLGSNCDWLDGKKFSESELNSGVALPVPQPAVSHEGDALIYDGSIDGAFVNLLKSASFHKLIITSDGGSVESSLEAGNLLRSRGAEVSVRGRCLSACVFVVAGGAVRTAELGAEIGVHQFYLTGPLDSASATAAAQQLSSLIVKYLEDNGVDPALFHEMVQVPPTEMKVLPYAQLVTWRLLQSSAGTAGLPPGTDTETIATGDSAGNMQLKRLVFEARDMVGGDGTTLKGLTQDDCEAKCRSDTLCKGYTYDRWNRLCLQKAGTGLLRIEPRSITVLFAEQAPRESSAPLQMTKRNGRAFPNAPYKRLSFGSYDECANYCMDDGRCLGMNFTEASNKCDLFAAPSEYAPKDGVSLGIKSQVSTVQ